MKKSILVHLRQFIAHMAKQGVSIETACSTYMKQFPLRTHLAIAALLEEMNDRTTESTNTAT